MRKTKHWLLTAAVLLCSLTTDAHDFEVDGIFYNIISSTDLTVEVTFKGSSYSSYYSDEYNGAVTIPNTVVYDGVKYDVVSIGDYAFYDCAKMPSITIPESVTSIGNRAFQSCDKLISISIPYSVITIGEYAFAYSGLTSITLSEGLSSIGDAAFTCSGLTSVTIPQSVTSIGKEVFRSCSELTTIVVAEGNEKYDSRNGCNAIIVTRTNELIVGCKSTIIPEGITSIGESAFFECRNLTSVILPEGLVSIGNKAFDLCSSLASIIIPEGVKSIGNQAFEGCSSCASVVVPSSVTTIGYYAFSGCTGELNVNCNIPSSSSNTYGAFYNAQFSKVTIGEGVISIGAYAFHSCTSLATISMQNGLTSIGNYAFCNCRSLTSVIVPENVTSIGNSAFGRCSSLTSVVLPESVSSIGSYAFSGCSNLTSVNIPEKTTKISNGTFESCSSLTSIDIPKRITSIGSDAFSHCSSLLSINIPEGVVSIGTSAFYNCIGLESIVLPSSVTNIYGQAFANCSELLNVYCNAETIPTTNSNTFNGSYPEYATLHVPTTAVSTYKATTPWSSFGTIQGLTYEAVEEITLSHTAVTLNEGEHLTLTATVTPDYATDPSVTWSSNDENVVIVSTNGEITAIAPGSAIITATANDESGVSASCSVIVEKTTAVTITINQYGSGTYCSKYTLDFSEVEGLRAYAATGYDTGTGIVTLTRVMTAKAGTGLFLKGTPGEYEVPVLESTSYNTLNMLAGTLESTVVNSTSDDGIYANYKYTILDGDAAPMFYQFADGSTLSAGKAYLQIPVAWLPSEAKSISLRFDDGETTDIEEMENQEQSSGVIYDLMGRRVTTPQRGSLYLIDGKKIIY